ncbi:MAG: hypothetical protein LBT89_06840 [Planctomycetaceae bacterium]|jgi:hypothetical protein|nr:hypothetical protein [Planctomycetaceae bacterium]
MGKQEIKTSAEQTDYSESGRIRKEQSLLFSPKIGNQISRNTEEPRQSIIDRQSQLV